jgi:MFS family permease
MFRTRKMGRSFEVEGTPNQSAVVYNFGGPLLVFGWFWFWIGLNVISATPDAWYLPVYLTTRTTLAFVGAILVIVSLWMAGFALDESDQGTANGLSEESYGLGVAPGIFFGKVSEIIIPVTAAWAVFGVAAFLPFFAGFWPVFLFLAFVVQGVILSFVHQMAVRSGVTAAQPEFLTKWNRYSYLGFTLLVLLMFASGTLLLTWNSMVRTISAVLGVVLFCVGQHLIQHDRKRGWHWMETSQVNPNPVVYSHGIPIFSLGVMLLAYAMTIIP